MDKYVRKCVFTENVEKLFKDITNCKDRRYKLKNGYFVKTKSQRYHVFAKSVVCCVCGMKGTIAALEKNTHEKGNSEKDAKYAYHINLYGVSLEGEEILMTKDHIIPKSRGGANTIDNYQTMCYVCNNAKGCSLESEEE